MANSVTLKGTMEGINAFLPSDKPLKTVVTELIKKLEESRSFFEGVKYDIIIKGRNLSQSEKLILEKSIVDTLQRSDIGIKYGEDIEEEKKERIREKSKAAQDARDGYTMFHEGTLRNGQQLRSDGNLIIIGDTNPGSEIIAAGNIVVMGAVNGVVHAGCMGNRNAFVVALHLNPTQIRIADIITRKPDNDINRSVAPEKAYIKDNTIYIDEYHGTAV